MITHISASNLANAGSVSGDPDAVYRAKHPVFASFTDTLAAQGPSGVKLEGVVESRAPLTIRYQPEHPEADENGNVFVTNVNTVEEMVNMMSASRAYQNNVELINTTRDMLLQTLRLGHG